MAQTIEAEIIRLLREQTRLRTQARKYRRQLKANAVEQRRVKRELRALQLDLENRRPDVAPMRLFNGAVGIGREK